MKQKAATILVLTALLAGCRSTAAPVATPPRQVVTTLFFGLGMKDGTTLPDKTWAEFVEREVTPRFPDGFTVQSADGAWRDAGRTRHEPSRLIIIVHVADTAAEDRIETIRWTYRSQFQQDSVLRVDQPADRVLF